MACRRGVLVLDWIGDKGDWWDCDKEKNATRFPNRKAGLCRDRNSA
jgi:hypothetical protein